MRPMLATRGTTVPSGPEWLHEVKWDGMRVLVEVAGGRLRLLSRNENDVTVSFPELAGLADVCGGRDFVLDGEVVAFTDGVPVFGALADRMHVRNRRKAELAAARNPVTLVAFDLLSLDGLDLTSLPLSERRAALESLGLDSPRWQVPPAYDDGELLLSATEAQGLEGVVSKRRSSTYRPGQRTEEWLKFPHRPSGSYVVGGWRFETGSATRLGALLVGEATGDGLRYRGRVGSGVTGKAASRLLAVLEPLHRSDPPFSGTVPREDALGTVWVEPRVVVEVASLGMTPQGRLRQPSYLGVRHDLEPGDLADLGGGEDG
jgi:bifunctional non-homologous end joining protein LigD